MMHVCRCRSGTRRSVAYSTQSRKRLASVWVRSPKTHLIPASAALRTMCLVCIIPVGCHHYGAVGSMCPALAGHVDACLKTFLAQPTTPMRVSLPYLRVRLAKHDSTHTGTVCAADKARRAAAKAASEEEAAGLARQWRNVERSLCSDRGLWAAPHKPEEAAWKLDKHEDSLRRYRPQAWVIVL